MYDYSNLGDFVHTPLGWGRYMSHKNGKVLVMIDWEEQPVKFEVSEVYLV